MIVNTPGGGPSLSPSDRRAVEAIGAVGRARTGVRVLRIGSILIAAGAVIGAAIVNFGSEESGFLSSGWQRLGQYLSSVALPLAFAGLVLASSYLLDVVASRLDLDIFPDDDVADDMAAPVPQAAYLPPPPSSPGPVGAAGPHDQWRPRA